MADFPTVGLKVDLSGIDQGDARLNKLADTYDRLGTSAEKAQGAVTGSTAAIGAENVKVASGAEARAARIQRATAAERAAQTATATQAARNYADISRASQTALGLSSGASAEAARDAENYARKVQAALQAQHGLTEAQAAATIGLKATANAEEAVGVAAVESSALQVGAHQRAAASAFKIRETLVLIREFFRGDFSRMAGSASLLAGAFGLITTTVFLTAAALALLAAPFVIFIALVTDAQARADKFNNTLAAAGNYAGFTAQSFENMATRVQAATGASLRATENGLLAYAATGQFTAAEIEKLQGVTQRWADLTHEKTSKVQADFSKLTTAPGEYAAAFMASTHQISALQVQQIQDLERQHDHLGAVALAVDVVTGAINRQKVELSDWTKFWRSVGGWISDTTDKLVQFESRTDKASAAAKRAQADQMEANYQRYSLGGLVPAIMGTNPLAKIKGLRDEADALDQAAAAAEKKAAADVKVANAQVAAVAASNLARSDVPDATVLEDLRAKQATYYAGIHSGAKQTAEDLARETEAYRRVSDAIQRVTGTTNDAAAAKARYIPLAEREHQIAVLQAQETAAARQHNTALAAQLTTKITLLKTGADLVTNTEAQTKAQDAGTIAAVRATRAVRDADGAQNSLNRMTAEAIGLRRVLNSLNADPLSAMSERITKAGDEAAAARANGRGKDLAGEARLAAEETERVKILIQLRQESIANQRQSEAAMAAADHQAKAELQSVQIMRDFWAGGSRSMEEYFAALARSRDIVTEAAVAASNYAIAQRFGAESLDLISAALQRHGVAVADAQRQQDQAQAEAAAAAAGIRHGAAGTAAGSRVEDTNTFRTKDAEEFLRVLDRIDARAKSLADTMAGAFGHVGDALGGILTAMSGFAVKQQQIKQNAIKLQADLDTSTVAGAAKYAAIEKEAAQDSAQARMDAYGQMASAAKGFFAEGTKGYGIMAAAERAFRIVEFAMSAKSIIIKTVETAAKLGLFGAQAQAAAAAGAAEMFAALGPLGFAAVAAMVAVLAGFGIRALSSGGSKPIQSAEDIQKATGTGTVLGSVGAKSSSITRSLEIAASAQNTMLEYQSGMLTALKSIDSNIGNLTDAVARSLSLTSGVFDTSGLGLGTTKSGGAIGRLFGLGKTTTTTLQDQGLQFTPQTLAQLLSGVAGQTYQTVLEESKRKILGITISSSSTTKTTTGALPDDIVRQIQLVVGSLKTGVLAAAAELGVTGAEATLNAFVIDLGKLSFKDMDAQQIQDQLTAVFGKLGDQMTKAIVPDIQKFQKAGEGLMETLVRVAREYEVVDVVMKSIGKTFGTVGLASIEARDRLVQLAGGLDTFTSQAEFFAKNFLTDAERLAPIQTAVANQMAALGYAGVTTRDQFKALVLGLDVSTEAGAKLYTALMAVAPAFAQVTDAIAQQIANEHDALSAAADRASTALQGTIDKFGSLADNLEKFIEQLSTGTEAMLSPAAQYAATQQRFREVAALAAKRNEKALQDLPGAGQDYLTASKAYQPTSLGYFRDLAEVRRAATVAEAAARTTADVAQRQLTALTTTVTTLLAINDNVVSVRDQIIALTNVLNGTSANSNVPSADIATPVGAVSLASQRLPSRAPATEQVSGMLSAANSSPGGTEVLVTEIRASKAELQGLRTEQRELALATARNTARLERTITSVTRGGKAMQTEAAA